MTPRKFKTGLKEVQEKIKGLTLQLRTGEGTRPYRSLKSFGYAVLKEEQKGVSFLISQVWTKNNGTQKVNSFEALTELLNRGLVIAVSFTSYYQAENKADYINNVFGTNA